MFVVSQRTLSSFCILLQGRFLFLPLPNFSAYFDLPTMKSIYNIWSIGVGVVGGILCSMYFEAMMADVGKILHFRDHYALFWGASSTENHRPRRATSNKPSPMWTSGINALSLMLHGRLYTMVYTIRIVHEAMLFHDTHIKRRDPFRLIFMD